MVVNLFKPVGDRMHSHALVILDQVFILQGLWTLLLVFRLPLLVPKIQIFSKHELVNQLPSLVLLSCQVDNLLVDLLPDRH